nr:hypothetical protein [uncultured Tyzzerella sp.]
MENNIDLKNVNLILSSLKNINKNEKKDNRLLKINSLNNNGIKNMLPFITEDNENICKMIDCLEINQLINKYKTTYKNIDKEQILDLKKEAISHIRKNLNDNNKYMADLVIKALEIKDIINKNYKRGENNGL